MDQTEILEVGEDREDSIDIFQVVIIQDKNVKAFQWLEEFFIQGFQFIPFKTELSQMGQIVKCSSEIQKSNPGQFLTLTFDPPVNMRYDIPGEI